MQRPHTFYTDTGSGQPVVMIHGWACDGSDWSWLSAALAGSYRVVVPDLRGHGRSGAAPASPSPGYAPEDFAADIVDLITSLELTNAVLVGHSLGGIVASLIATSHPQLVAGVVVVDPAYGARAGEMDTMLDAVKAVPHKIALAAFASFYGEPTPPWLPTWHARRVLGSPVDVLRDTMLGMFSAGSPGLREVAEPILRQRAAPILAIYAGDHEAQAEWEMSLSPRSTVEVWHGFGHFLHQEDPERFAARVTEWLGTLGQPVI